MSASSLNPFRIRSALRERGLLGINARNAMYTLKWNNRRFYPRVDDKMQTKALCQSADIPTAPVLGVADEQSNIPQLLKALDSSDGFALKPSHGAMGNGILVITEQSEGRYRKAGGEWLDRAALHFHASSIISGLYAIGGQPDVAFAEALLHVHPDFARVSSNGVPDVRIVIYRGVPVMAMTRLPTEQSRGRANLHQGAIGAGVDLASGRTTHAFLNGVVCEIHPDSQVPVIDLPLPDFERILDIAVHASDLTELGYVGADVVVDADRGALILELNARPGLAIQMANQCGLRQRLDEVDRRWREDMSRPERIRLGQEIGATP